MQSKEEIIYGLNPVMEALRGTRQIFELFLAGSSSDKRMEKLLKLAAERKVPVRQREKADLNRLCGTDHHQGVALTAEPFPYADLDDILEELKGKDDGLILVLDSVQDPHNLGALIRSAACAGAHAVVIPKDRAAGVTAAAEKASAGATETIAVAQVTNLTRALQQLQQAIFQTVEEKIAKPAAEEMVKQEKQIQQIGQLVQQLEQVLQRLSQPPAPTGPPAMPPQLPPQGSGMPPA